MATGKINFIDHSKGYGWISPDDKDGPERIKLKQHMLLGEEQFAEFEIGMPVEFELNEEGRARWVRAADSGTSKKEQQAEKAPIQQNAKQKKEYSFLNPYNFVRFLEPKHNTDGHIFGKCPPPPHDRFVGYSGRITCLLESQSPLFVSDSENVYELDNGHKVYRFFKQKGEFAIPASSLRGMVRNVFEAATNSCMMHFAEDKIHGRTRPLEYRMNRAPEDAIPARVAKLDANGAILEVLDCSRDIPGSIERSLFTDKNGEFVSIIKSGAFPTYLDFVFRKEDGKDISFDPDKVDLPESSYDGMRVAVLVNLLSENMGRYQYFQIADVVTADQHTTLVPANNQEKLFGYLHLTGPNIEKKRDERVFFRWDDRSPAKPELEKIPETIPISNEIIAEYDDHLELYWARNSDKVKALGKIPWLPPEKTPPYPSNFVQEKPGLRVDSLVYVFQHNGKIHLRPVCIPRVPYAKTRKELLPDYHKKKCGEHENDATKFNDLNLCPACRVFGWVAPKKTDALQAFAGRVQFTHAKLKDERKVEKFENLITLAILGPPQPTNTRFYLKPQNGTEPNNWPDKWEDTQCGYQKGNVLRGRKFYRHHGMELVGRTFHGLYPEMPEKNAPAKHEFERIDGKADKQNCTLAETLKAGNKFEFSIHFQSLAREELGALLWALEMESDMVHRLGLAKPLGFGSVNVEVDKIQLADVRERYAAFNYHAVDALKDAKLTKWKKRIVDDFKKAMAKLYRNDDNTFHQLDNIVDLKALLKNETPKKPVHYPRLSAIPDTEGKNFEWFVRNKKSFKGKPEKEWKHALPLAPEDNKGLPIEHTKNRSS